MNIEASVSDTDSDQHIRNQILVVAGVVAAASYQAAMSHPSSLKDGPVGPLVVFFCACTLAWSFASTLILAISSNLPYRREIYGAFTAMGFSFGYAVADQTKDARSIASILFVVFSCIPLLIRGVSSWCKCCK
ncbi:hypothetical protein CTI12_AA056490 [Artemisia annua]|uniref:Uncharacterized protein n=1 Tax=Artemisia annua TaxID=35608 RepID=A0A2U1Q9A5_ARTAN|nr:hypothetical protein CTI12_AA056490 [Artemisia annua]